MGDSEQRSSVGVGTRRFTGGRRGIVTVSLAVALVVGALSGSAQAAGDDRGGVSRAVVTGLETDASNMPLGIDESSPRLSWRLESRARGVRQTAFRVVVRRESARALAHGYGPVVWDSGRVRSATPWVDYAGPALASRTRYSWSVRVWRRAR